MINSSPRRVLFVDHTAVLAGGEIALLNLVRHLDRARYEPIVCLLAEGPLSDELHKANVQTHVLATDGGLLNARKDSIGAASLLRGGAISASLKSIGQIKSVIEKTGADLVHCNSLKSDFLGGAAARLARRPVIWHIRDRVEDDYLSPAATHLVRTAANIIPTHVVANSYATLKTIHLHNPPSGSVVYSGLDLRPYLAIEPAPSAQSLRVGMIGRLTHWKGQHVFLNAAAAVHSRIPSTQFQIVGGPLFSETDYQAALHQQAATLGIAAVTEFTGHRDDVPELMKSMDVVVHASVTPEPFGQVVVLAMASGKPVIATNGGGVPEIVTHGQNGLLIPMDDAAAMAGAIERLLVNRQLAAELGRAARARAQNHFSIEKTAGQMMDLYDQILGHA